MRRLRSSSWCIALGATVALSASTEAQGGASDEGALFLLLPVGARAAALGQAVSGVLLHDESIWWNPAGLGSISDVHVAIHHSQSLVGTGDAVSLAAPFGVLGVFALSASTVNFGEQETGGIPGFPEGFLVPRSVVLGASYATGLGAAVNAGLTYKLVQLRADCSGSCPGSESFNASTSALDFGAQITPAGSHPLTYGVAVRNIGPKLQVVDREQADPLPTRLHLGLNYRVTPIERSLDETTVHIAAEVTGRVRLRNASWRIGSEASYQQRFFLRAGYIAEEGAGGVIGGGILAGNLIIDIARVLAGVSADAGVPPTFISLKYRFR